MVSQEAKRGKGINLYPTTPFEGVSLIICRPPTGPDFFKFPPLPSGTPGEAQAYNTWVSGVLPSQATASGYSQSFACARYFSPWIFQWFVHVPRWLPHISVLISNLNSSEGHEWLSRVFCLYSDLLWYSPWDSTILFIVDAHLCLLISSIQPVSSFLCYA